MSVESSVEFVVGVGGGATGIGVAGVLIVVMLAPANVAFVEFSTGKVSLGV